MKIKPNLVLKMMEDDNGNVKKDNFSELLRKPEAAVVNATDDNNEHGKNNYADFTGLYSGGFENPDDFNSLSSVDYNNILQKPHHEPLAKVSEVDDELEIDANTAFIFKDYNHSREVMWYLVYCSEAIFQYKFG